MIKNLFGPLDSELEPGRANSGTGPDFRGQDELFPIAGPGFAPRLNSPARSSLIGLSEKFLPG